jgi:hypothetical protein
MSVKKQLWHKSQSLNRVDGFLTWGFSSLEPMGVFLPKEVAKGRVGTGGLCALGWSHWDAALP